MRVDFNCTKADGTFKKQKPDAYQPLKFDYSDYTSVLLTINWRSSKKRILAAIGKIVRQIEPPGIKHWDRRGKKDRDRLVMLERLAVMRLLHPEWLRQEETRLLARSLTEQSDDVDEAVDGHPISDRFAGLLAAELARLAMTLLEKETDPEKRWQRLCEVHRELSQLRRDDHRAVRTRIKRERWNREVEREDEETDKRLEEERKAFICTRCGQS